jgi:5-methylcytosine-specific restriction endonuclease McrA
MASFVHRLQIPTIPFKERNRSERLRELGINTGWKWRKFRNQLLAASPLCARCARLGEVVHHVVPRHVAPERMYDITNCQVLCNRCHDEVHGKRRH